MSLGTVPETDTVYYAMWNVLIVPGFTVGEVKCGTDLARNTPAVTCSEPDRYYVYNIYWTNEEPGVAVGGTAYELYVCLNADFGWIFDAEQDPFIEGAEVVFEELNGNQHYIHLNVTPVHYTDETSAVEERILTPATATEAGQKQICVYCAGGCGEIVETRTEAIPATGVPEEPAETQDVCPWCGETHDPHTLIGWLTEFLHDFLFVTRSIFVRFFEALTA